MKNENVQSFLSNQKLELFLKSKDYSVSQESFSLMLDPSSDLLITYPQPDEVDLPKYYQSDAYISHTDGSRGFLEKAYQFVKKITIRNKVKLISPWMEESSYVLDLGCGTGDFLKACAENNWKVVGVEPNNIARNLAEKKIDLQKGKVIYKSLEKLNEDVAKELNQKFSIITLWHVLEHVPDPLLYLSTLKDLLEPNGRIILALPNFNSHDAQHYQKFWAAYDLPRHLWHFSKKAVSSLANAVGMETEKILPMPFDAFYVSLLSEKYAYGQTNYLSALYRGLKSNSMAKSSGEYSSLIYILKNN
ncbi:class I SAM-dependent methyltransferase [Namhaeicola litoreus]|uniref:Class I SAM-dependent methyltransferase n=1 Tax=Namhaeicola litoreus TaxID=1052145 RepID=A0ABW3XZM0_9FLAO